MALRRRISQCFELASLPGTTEAERAQLLHFVVVGGARPRARQPASQPALPLARLSSSAPQPPLSPPTSHAAHPLPQAAPPESR